MATKTAPVVTHFYRWLPYLDGPNAPCVAIWGWWTNEELATRLTRITAAKAGAHQLVPVVLAGLRRGDGYRYVGPGRWPEHELTEATEL